MQFFCSTVVEASKNISYQYFFTTLDHSYVVFWKMMIFSSFARSLVVSIHCIAFLHPYPASVSALPSLDLSSLTDLVPRQNFDGLGTGLSIADLAIAVTDYLKGRNAYVSQFVLPSRRWTCQLTYDANRMLTSSTNAASGYRQSTGDTVRVRSRAHSRIKMDPASAISQIAS